MAFREFYLGIKKRYDMQKRAHRFRVKQKQEIAKLKMTAQGQEMPKDEVSTPTLGQQRSEELGKRSAPPSLDNLDEM